MAKITKNKWLAKQLTDRHAVGLLLKFLKSTQIKNKKNATKKKEEREQRQDWD